MSSVGGRCLSPGGVFCRKLPSTVVSVPYGAAVFPPGNALIVCGCRSSNLLSLQQYFTFACIFRVGEVSPTQQLRPVLDSSRLKRHCSCPLASFILVLVRSKQYYSHVRTTINCCSSLSFRLFYPSSCAKQTQYFGQLFGPQFTHLFLGYCRILQCMYLSMFYVSA